MIRPRPGKTQKPEPKNPRCDIPATLDPRRPVYQQRQPAYDEMLILRKDALPVVVDNVELAFLFWRCRREMRKPVKIRRGRATVFGQFSVSGREPDPHRDWLNSIGTRNPREAL
jgi:hypothetical protein